MTEPGRSTRGDLILLTPGANAISEMIQAYDRGRFTHVGIDRGDGTLVNCRTEGGLFLAGENGGVRIDRFTDLDARQLYRAPVLLPQELKDVAVDVAEQWVEEDGLGTISGFSFPKMFQCAAAVNASRPEATFPEKARSAMLTACLSAADAWRFTADRPSFFCAEMVVEAYRWEVPTALLAPPEPLPPTRERFPLPVDRLVEHVQDAWEAGRRGATLATVLGTVGWYDPRFFGGAGSVLWSWITDTGREKERASGGTAPETLPPALVTPRMLEGCEWVGPAEPVT